jgi:hypothetical protein
MIVNDYFLDPSLTKAAVPETPQSPIGEVNDLHVLSSYKLRECGA